LKIEQNMIMELNQNCDTEAGLPGIEEVCRRCHFIRQASSPDCVHAPGELYDAMLANVLPFQGGDEYAHLARRQHPGYDSEALKSQLRHLKEQGTITSCQRIRELGFNSCPANGCTLVTGLKTSSPADLAGWSGVDIGKLPDPVILHTFQERHFQGGLVFVNEAYHGYRNGVFQKIDERAGIRKPLAEHLGNSATSGRVQSLNRLLQDCIAESASEFTPNSNYLGLNNGALNLTTLELEKYRPELRLQNKLDVEWIPTATCDRFNAYQEQVFSPDSDREQKKFFLQEWAGYLLTRDTSQQMMVLFVGNGANGKTVFIRQLVNLLGSGNVSSASLDSLDRSYIRADLDGKLLNVSYEISTGARIDDGYFKAIVSGEPIEAAFKFKPSFTYTPTVRLMASTNNLPQCRDVTDATFRRIVVIQFNRQFSQEQQNPLLMQELRLEMPGILQWAVAGLRRMRQRGRFEVPPSSIEALNVYRSEANPVRQFAEEFLTASPNGRGVVSTALFHAFVAWGKERKLPTGSHTSFGRALAAMGFKKRKSGQEFWLVSQNPANCRRFANLPNPCPVAVPTAPENIGVSVGGGGGPTRSSYAPN
jgi:putative DNA primase/helicase